MDDRARAWHQANKMPENATLEQRIAWHVEHALHCGCREMPELIRKEIDKKTQIRPNKS